VEQKAGLVCSAGLFLGFRSVWKEEGESQTKCVRERDEV
jgi:hypothetical protein